MAGNLTRMNRSLETDLMASNAKPYPTNSSLDRSMLSRRQLALGSAAIAALSGASSVRAMDRPQPNILFIMADDMGYADLSCFGRRDYKTPHIDRLASQGLRLEQAYANSSVCSATRVALITGRYQYRLPIGLEEPLQARDIGLPPETPTMPGMLKSLGYETALVGKWHMGRMPKYGPLLSGYDHFWGFRGGGVDYFTHQFGAGRPDLWDDDRPVRTEGYLTDLLGDRAVEMLEHFAARPGPFMMSLHFNAPHWPWEGPDDGPRAAELAESTDPMAIYDLGGGSLKTYAEIVTRLDFQVGRVMQALERLNLHRETIVVFTSDNGGERFSDTWPLTGRKGELLEGGIRVPTIIRWPGRVPAGTVSQEVTLSMDWLPTFMAAAGAPPMSVSSTDGLDLAPIFRGEKLSERSVFWRFRSLGQEACRRGDMKYLKIAGHTFLFNVREDPMERANLKNSHADVYAELVAEFEAWNATMLPNDPLADTYLPTGDHFADRNGPPAN